MKIENVEQAVNLKEQIGNEEADIRKCQTLKLMDDNYVSQLKFEEQKTSFYIDAKTRNAILDVIIKNKYETKQKLLKELESL